jgi:hypothetical protein
MMRRLVDEDDQALRQVRTSMAGRKAGESA